MLHQAKRYDKLNQVLALLEQARGSKEVGGEREGEGTGGKISELKDHIKTALDEAIRLRADTEALQTRAEVSTDSVLSLSLGMSPQANTNCVFLYGQRILMAVLLSALKSSCTEPACLLL